MKFAPENKGGFNSLWEGLPEVGSPQGSGQGSQPDLVEDLNLLGVLVNLIPNDKPDRDFWVHVAHAVHGASGGTGFEAFAAWSAKWTEGADSPAANWLLWKGIKDPVIGKHWLQEKAEEAGADTGRWAAQEAKAVFDDGVQHPVQNPTSGATTAGVGGVSPFHRTVAHEVEVAHGERMRFNHDTGCWYVFGAAVWEPQPATVKVGFLRAMDWVNRHILRLTAAQVKAVSAVNFYDGVEKILRQRLPIRHDQFDRDPWLLGTPGGVLNLTSGALTAARPADFISKQTTVTPAGPAPAGVAGPPPCPRWLKFVAEITKGDLMAATFLQQWLGYCLTGDTSEQKFVFLYGPGGNGKSVLMDTVARIMGGYFCKPVADLYFAKQGSRHMQEVAMLAGARMVTVSEVPPNAAWDEGKLKDHTGGGAITANFMRQNSFSFVPQFKLTALGNHKPTFPGGINKAIQRRFNLMLIDYQPKVPNPNLMAELWAEAPGILRWMIEGLTDPAHGWHAVRLTIPASVQTATDAFIHDQDSFGAWLEENVENAQGTKTSSLDLFNDWRQFQSANGFPAGFDNTNLFATEMGRRGYRKVKTMKNALYLDIRLISKAKQVF
jgi:putative DNA primase/helicase